ncbi:MAG TPA: rhomboid family intramembrane serine protease [Methylomirabilota bacterium]|nr:rhomboid family intramembrane serine protease [Methylomirabilota bacterium]
MIPLKDDVPSSRVPYVTIGLIALNVLVFLYQASIGIGGDPRAAEAFAFEFGAVPCRITGACPADFPSPYVTIFTSMFLHGGLLHVGGNMLYLWIFGDNVEDTLGHVRFIALYLAAGVVAALTQIAVAPRSPVPMIGASGAVSGVLGAYIMLFPFAGVHMLILIGFFARIMRWPALVVLGLWILVQFVSGILTFSSSAWGGGEAGGTAWFAHIGGFLAGMALLFLMRPRRVGRL